MAALPLGLVGGEDLALSVIANVADVDIAADVELLRAEHGHGGGRAAVGAIAIVRVASVGDGDGRGRAGVGVSRCKPCQARGLDHVTCSFHTTPATDRKSVV